MLYKKLLILCCLILLNNCTATTSTKNISSNSLDNPFLNKGFSLIYDDKFYDDKIISKKIDERSLIIFQKNLKKNTIVKITNILNTSAKKLHHKNKFKLLKKYIINEESFNSINENLIASIITPDKDIIPDAQNLDPAYIVFDNYEKILQWNRSLRFSLAVCTLKEKFENAL
jgi:hypothetical protein